VGEANGKRVRHLELGADAAMGFRMGVALNVARRVSLPQRPLNNPADLFREHLLFRVQSLTQLRIDRGIRRRGGSLAWR
jgi:hypothetical protein